MVIDRAGPDDLDDLVALGRSMRAESVVPFPEIDPTAVAAHLRLVEAHPDRLFMALGRQDGAPAGMIGGVLGTYAFSHHRQASCDILFALPACRGRFAGVRLLSAFSDWAAGQGAMEIYLGVSTGIAPGRTERLLQKIGFTPLGRTFRKEINTCAMHRHSA